MSQQTALVGWIGPQLQRVLQRFPWAAVAATLFALYFILSLHRPDGVVSPETTIVRAFRIPAGLTLAFLWSLSVALHGEARGLSLAVRQLTTLAGFAVIAALVVLANGLDVMLGLLMPALMLGVGLAPYLRREIAQGAYWHFNHDLWIGFLASTIAALLFGLGLSAIIETLRYLFGLHIDHKVHEKIWAVAVGLVGPMYWASVVPEEFASAVTEGSPAEFVSRMVALLVKYILVPLLLVYAVILHVYALKIGIIDMALPKGRLGWLVLCFGSMVVLTALLSFPTRGSSGPLVALFWRLWPLLLAVPVLLLFIAVGRRIGDYGVTESRYWTVLMGLWLAGLAVTQGLGLWGRDLRVLSASLSVLLLAASLGPWGMYGWSTRSQVAQFTDALGKAGLLKDGRVVPGKPAANSPQATDSQRINSLIYYFSGRNRLSALRPFFAGDADDPFAAIEPAPRGSSGWPSSWQQAQRIRERLGIDPNSPGFKVINFYVQPTWSVALPDGGWLVQGRNVSRERGRSPPPGDLIAGPYKLKFTLDGSRLLVEDAVADSRTIFDLAPLDAEGGVLQTFRSGEPREPIVLRPVSGPLPVMVILTSLQATRGKPPGLEINGASFNLVIGPKR